MDYQEIEHSIITSSRKEIWRPFCKAVIQYELIEEGDKIMVCISGGKDSFLLAKCIQEMERHGSIPFTARYVAMDPGYSEDVLNSIIENAKNLNVPLEIFHSDVFEVTESIDRESPCYMCARMRRGALYSYAEKLSCNKIALGHHFNDVIETTLMSMLYGAEIKTMIPKLHSTNFKDITLIRPLYLVHEEDIETWRDRHQLKFIHCSCPLSSNKEEDSKRREIKELIRELKKINPNIENNIFKSMENVHLNCVLDYHWGKEKTSFLDLYKLKESANMNKED